MAIFWDGIEDQVRTTFLQAFSQQQLEDSLQSGPDVSTTKEKYDVLTSIAQNEVSRRRDHDPKSAREVLFTLAILQHKQGDESAEEATWREVIQSNNPSRPNLAALYNLAALLNRRKKYSEAEGILRPLTELIAVRLGENSQQYIGCVRELGHCVGGQDRAQEAKDILEVARKCALALEDEADRESHVGDIEKLHEELQLGNVL